MADARIRLENMDPATAKFITETLTEQGIRPEAIIQE